jgi:hypothetical protein
MRRGVRCRLWTGRASDLPTHALRQVLETGRHNIMGELPGDIPCFWGIFVRSGREWRWHMQAPPWQHQRGSRLVWNADNDSILRTGVVTCLMGDDGFTSTGIHNRAQHDTAFVGAVVASAAVHRGPLIPCFAKQTWSGSRGSSRG